MDPARLWTHSLRNAPWGGVITRILAAALEAVDPGRAVTGHLQLQGEQLVLDGQIYDLKAIRNIWLVGAGKAGAPMAQAVAGILGDRLAGGVVVVKEGYRGNSQLPHQVAVLEAGHPLPDERGARAARQINDLLAQTTTDDLVLVLISGGGSALLTAPVPGISLADLQALTGLLLACGAEIGEINALRKHLETIKGGNLARLAATAAVATMILSDVVGNRLEVIASGPTVPDPGTFAGALEILDRYALRPKVPPAIRERLEAGASGSIPETPKPGDPLFARVYNVIVGSNLQAAQAALAQAEREGFHAALLTSYLQGEARQAGRLLAAIARQIDASGQPLPRPACLIAGGETTVTLHGDGLGGRNQELALGAVGDLAGLSHVALVSLATDGGDGPTDAAGAVVTGETLARARACGLNPDDFLARNDAYHFFHPLGDLLRPGPTQTNVNDLALVVAW